MSGGSAFSFRMKSLSSLALLLILAGCGGGPDDAPPMFELKGTVTLDGQPLESGEIIFMPADGGGRPDAARIENGNYSLKVTSGEKRVEISATKEIPASDPGGIPDYESIIPAKYNENSELTASVAENDDNTADFQLTSK